MTFNELLENVELMARQTVRRVKSLRDGWALIGSGAEAWDHDSNQWRLPTPDEFTQTVIKGVGPPHIGYARRREFYPREAKTLIQTARHVARFERREHPELV